MLLVEKRGCILSFTLSLLVMVSPIAFAQRIGDGSTSDRGSLSPAYCDNSRCATGE